MTTPQVDDLGPSMVHGARGTTLTAMGKVPREFLPDRVKFWGCETIHERAVARRSRYANTHEGPYSENTQISQNGRMA